MKQKKLTLQAENDKDQHVDKDKDSKDSIINIRSFKRSKPHFSAMDLKLINSDNVKKLTNWYFFSKYINI